MSVIQLLAFTSLISMLESQETYFGGWNKQSTLTTTEPVEIPGMVLDPGTYVIKLEYGSSKRSVVQVLAADGSVVTRIYAVPDFRVHEGAEPFAYHQGPGNGVRILRSWFYPSDQSGLEFVYSKSRARQIARAANCHVVAGESDDFAQGAIVAVLPRGIEIVIVDAPKTQQPAAIRRSH